MGIVCELSEVAFQFTKKLISVGSGGVTGYLWTSVCLNV